MGKVREFVWRVLAFPRRRRLDAQALEEMRAHLQIGIEEAMRRGLSRAEAEREARLRAGNIASALEGIRDQRGLGLLDGTATDLRYAVQALRHQPGFVLIALGALALSVGINTLIFTIVEGVLLKPLPYPEPDRLVRVFERTPRNRWGRSERPPPREGGGRRTRPFYGSGEFKPVDSLQSLLSVSPMKLQPAGKSFAPRMHLFSKKGPEKCE